FDFLVEIAQNLLPDVLADVPISRDRVARMTETRAGGELDVAFAKHDARAAVGSHGTAALARVAALDDLGHVAFGVFPDGGLSFGMGRHLLAKLFAPFLHGTTELFHLRGPLGITGKPPRKCAELRRLRGLGRSRRLAHVRRLWWAGHREFTPHRPPLGAFAAAEDRKSVA